MAFSLAGMLDQLQDFRCGRLPEHLGDLHADQAALVDTTGVHGITHGNLARNAFSGQGDGVQAGNALDHHAVHRHLLARLDDNGFPDSHLARIHNQYLPFSLDIGRIGPDIHKLGDRFAAVVLGHILEDLADLEEEHDKDRLGELRFGPWQEPDRKSSDGGDSHQEILAEDFSLPDLFPSLGQDVIADHQVGNQIEEKQNQHGKPLALLHDLQSNQQYRGDCDTDPFPSCLLFHMILISSYNQLNIYLIFYHTILRSFQEVNTMCMQGATTSCSLFSFACIFLAGGADHVRAEPATPPS